MIVNDTIRPSVPGGWGSSSNFPSLREAHPHCPFPFHWHSCDPSFCCPVHSLVLSCTLVLLLSPLHVEGVVGGQVAFEDEQHCQSVVLEFDLLEVGVWLEHHPGCFWVAVVLLLWILLWLLLFSLEVTTMHPLIFSAAATTPAAFKSLSSLHPPFLSLGPPSSVSGQLIGRLVGVSWLQSCSYLSFAAGCCPVQQQQQL